MPISATKVFGVPFNIKGERTCRGKCGETKLWPYRHKGDFTCPDCMPPEPPPPLCPGGCGKIVMSCACTQAGVLEPVDIFPQAQVHTFLNLSADRDAEETITREAIE